MMYNGYMKICTKCLLKKPLEDFAVDRSKIDGRRTRCKDCMAEYAREYKKKNPEKIRQLWRDASKRYNTPEGRRAKLLKKYNLTHETFEALKEKQGGVCGICFRPLFLVVDHDHVTGEVRGLLCNQCNTGIGSLGDDIERLRSAIKYLT